MVKFFEKTDRGWERTEIPDDPWAQVRQRHPDVWIPNPDERVDYFVGLDLGQSQDFSALSIAERHVPGRERPRRDERRYDVRHLQRWPLHTPYTEIVKDVRELVARPELRGRGRVTLAVDATGVGPPVIDLLQGVDLQAYLMPITITGGFDASHEGLRWHVPKRDLVSTVQVLLQANRLRIADVLPEAATLTEELQIFQVKITDAGNDTYGAWRTGTHDDLVLATALALWSAENENGEVWFY